MKLHRKKYKAWAIKGFNDGRPFFLGRYFAKHNHIFPEFEGSMTLLFKTRDVARAWLKKRFGYLKNREDLKGPPFNWKMPQVVRVEVTIKEVQK